MVQPITIDAGKVSFQAIVSSEEISAGKGSDSTLDLSLSDDVVSRLRNNKVYVVIGASNGLVPLYAAANSNTNVIVAEPDLEARVRLEQSIKLNKWQSRFQWLDLTASEQSADDIVTTIAKLDNVGVMYFNADQLAVTLLEQLLIALKGQAASIYLKASAETTLGNASTFLNSANYSYAQTFGLSMTHLFKLKAIENQPASTSKLVGDSVSTELKQKLDEANLKYRQAGADISSLKVKLDEANQKYRSASDNISALKTTMQQHAAEHKSVLAELTSAQEKYQQVSEQFTQHKQTAAEKKQQQQQALTELQQLLEQANAKYRAATENIAALKTKLEKNTAELLAKQLQHVQFLEQNEQLTNELNTLIAQQSQFKTNELALQQQLAEHQQLLQYTQQQCDQLTAELTQITVKLKHSEENYAQLVETRRTEIEATQQQLELLTELQQVKQRSIYLNPLYQQLEQTKSGLQATNDQLQQHNSSLNTKLVNEQQLSSKLNKKVSVAQRELTQTKVQLEQVQQAQHSLMQKHINDRSQLDLMQALAKPALAEYSVPPLLPAPLVATASWQIEHQQRVARLSTLKVACIMDEFTYGSYAPEANLLQLTPEYWQRELEGFVPQLLFIESAWRGKHEIWGNKVGHKCQELVEIVQWCNQRNIPTVFWNKEDPVHFETFISTAKLFDHVFTTDLDCIHRYKAALEHNQVYLLPFAAQPKVNNPIEIYNRKAAFCFAGAYYVRYPDRTRDLESFLQALPNYKPFEIYDRNYGKDDANYQFPAEYQPYIVGNLPFEQIDKAYKGYQYAINLNSIKHSQTMFARRVYELLASNTLTISNYARGVKLLFGDLVGCSDSGEQVLSWLQHTEQSTHTADSLRLLALRSVMQYHTYQDRLAYIASKAGLLSQADVLPRITILAYASNQQRYDALVKQFNQQNYQHKRLLLAYGDEVSQQINTADIVSLNINDLKQLKATELAGSNGWLGFMVPEDEYTADYLTDMALATRYAPGSAVGKGSHWRLDTEGNPALNYPGQRYKTGAELEARHALVQAKLLTDTDLYQHLRTLYKLRFVNADNLAIDAMNYCKGGADALKAALLSAIVPEFNRQNAANFYAIQQHAEQVQSSLKGVSLVLTAADILQHCQQDISQNTKLTAVVKHNQLQLSSQLPAKKHAYCYFNQPFTLSHLLQKNKASTAMQCRLVISKHDQLDCKIVLQWLNHTNEVIEQYFADANQSMQCAIPDNAVTARLGLRLAGAGKVSLQAVELTALEHVAEQQLPALQAAQLQALFTSPKNSKVSLILANQVLDVVSTLADAKHEYYYANKPLALTELPVNSDNQLNFHLETTPGMNVQLLVGFLDVNKQKIAHDIRYANKNHSLDVPENTAFVQLALRFYAGGSCSIKRLIWAHLVQDPQQLLPQSDVLLLTNHYPSYQDLYRNGFVHSRIKAYREQGVNVDVFRLRQDEPVSWHEYQGVEVITASQYALKQMLSTGQYRHVLVHFLDATMWDVLKEFIDTVKVTVWVHGADIQPWHRRAFNYDTVEQIEKAKQLSELRSDFWHSVLRDMHSNLKLVFVSRYFAEEVMEDLGYRLPDNQYEVIHNPIDTALFSYQEKDPQQRKKILSIRPYSSKVYANDLAVKAVLELVKEPFFNELEFMFVGDGILFDEITEPLQQFSNVTIQKGFLTQQEIAALHKEYGVFLCPSRYDTQGVSRDEAMSSGLIPITNNVAAIPEFVDSSCSVLSIGEDYIGIAQGIVNIVKNAKQFELLSAAAAARARKQVDKNQIVAQELAVFAKPSKP